MELDELKTQWKRYDDELNKHDLLNEHALRQLIATRNESNPVYSRSKEYYAIAFSALVLLVFGILMFHVNNNPPMQLTVGAVLLVTVVSIGMSIYKVSFLSREGNDDFGTVVIAGMEHSQLALRRANLFSVVFSRVLLTFLFLLLFFGLSVKTF